MKQRRPHYSVDRNITSNAYNHLSKNAEIEGNDINIKLIFRVKPYQGEPLNRSSYM